MLVSTSCVRLTLIYMGGGVWHACGYSSPTHNMAVSPHVYLTFCCGFYRLRDVHEPQKFNYFADLPSSNIGGHHPPPGFAPVLLQGPPGAPPLPVNPPISPHPVPKLAPSPASPNAASSVSDEFASLSLKRVSKALKLISPTTNAPIKPAEDPFIACSSSGSDCTSFTHAEGYGRSPPNSRSFIDFSKVTVCPFKEPVPELPTGSRLRRWICPEPDSPSRAGSSSSSASVASDLTLDKSVGSERKETALDLDVCPSDDSSSTGLVVNHKTRFDLAPTEDDCYSDGIPKGSKLWIWMGKDEK